jgi:hypothetical protein
MGKPTRKPVTTCIVISDTHCGCRMASCGRDPVPIDGGGTVNPSRHQLVLMDWWDEFWGEWVPKWTKGGPFCVVHNGDCIDGVHHNSTTQLSHDLLDQKKVAVKLLKPVVEMCEGRYYHIRGTAAHVGQSSVQEEEVARELGAIKNSDGQHARFELWLKLGDRLCHFLHHVGTTSSSAHESSAVNAELTAEFVEAARWGDQHPDVVVRSHRHRAIKVSIPTARGEAYSLVTPAWQLRTPFAMKIPGARLSPPQIGGSIICRGDRALWTDTYVKHMERAKVESP